MAQPMLYSSPSVNTPNINLNKMTAAFYTFLSEHFYKLVKIPHTLLTKERPGQEQEYNGCWFSPYTEQWKYPN